MRGGGAPIEPPPLVHERFVQTTEHDVPKQVTAIASSYRRIVKWLTTSTKAAPASRRAIASFADNASASVCGFMMPLALARSLRYRRSEIRIPQRAPPV
jgi:hypothetical protein